MSPARVLPLSRFPLVLFFLLAITGITVGGEWRYLGNPDLPVPAEILAPGSYKAVAAGGSHTVALKADGTVTAWGNNGSGQCNVPAGLAGVTAVAAGNNFTLALKGDGTIAAWGGNGSGQISIPAGFPGVKAIAAGTGHTLVLKQDGTVTAWGSPIHAPTKVPAGLSQVVAIAGGEQSFSGFEAGWHGRRLEWQ